MPLKDFPSPSTLVSPPVIEDLGEMGLVRLLQSLRTRLALEAHLAGAAVGSSFPKIFINYGVCVCV